MILIFGVLLLAGCQSGPATQAQIQSMGNQCQAYGFKPGSDNFAACVLQLDENRVTAANEYRQRVGAGLQATGASMQRRPVSCSSFGNTVTCY